MSVSILRIKDKNGNWVPIPAIKGEKGKDGTVSFNDLSEEQKESLKGKDGKDGFGEIVQTTGTRKDAVMSQNVVSALFEASDEKIAEATKEYYLRIAPKTVENCYYSLYVNGIHLSSSGTYVRLERGLPLSIQENDGTSDVKVSPTAFGAADAVTIGDYETVVVTENVESDYYLWIGDNY